MSSDRKSRWKLSTISNVTLLAIYLIGSVAVVALVNSNAKQQALRNAELYSGMILDRNVVTHTFFSHALKSDFFSLLGERAFGALATAATDEDLPSDYNLFTVEGLYYKESSVNARNQAHEADPAERRFIEQLNADPRLTSTSAIRDYDGQPFFTVMRRGQVVRQECLACHGDPAQAPPGVVAHYGSERGFHHQAGQTISAVSIRVPLAYAYQDANRFSFNLSVFLMLILMVILALHYGVTRRLLFEPIDALQRKAQRIANDPEHLGDTLPLPVGRELGELVDAFNSMSSGLRRHHDIQEQIIRHRTAELVEANQALSDDIEARKWVEHSLEQMRQYNEMILHTTSEGILGINAGGQIMFSNRSAQDLIGLDESPADPAAGLQVKPIRIQDIITGIPTQEAQSLPAELIHDVFARGTRVEHQEGRLTRRDGRTLPIEYSCVPLAGKDITGAVCTFRDITERKCSESEIQKLAFYDQLTGLPNRTLFYDRITQRVAQVERDQQKLALMFMDLDDFKLVNDTLGHAAGDDFLKTIAQRLRQVSRQADTVARLGGDEFVWFGEILDEEDAGLIAVKFLEAIGRPVVLGEHNFSSTVSIGIALFPDSARDVTGLMKCADLAMYAVKQKSKNAYRFYRGQYRP